MALVRSAPGLPLKSMKKRLKMIETNSRSTRVKAMNELDLPEATKGQKKLPAHGGSVWENAAAIVLEPCLAYCATV